MTCPGWHQRRYFHLVLHTASSLSAGSGSSGVLWPDIAVYWHAAPPAIVPSQKEVLALQSPLEGKIEVKITKYCTAKNTHAHLSQRDIPYLSSSVTPRAGYSLNRTCLLNLVVLNNRGKKMIKYYNGNLLH